MFKSYIKIAFRNLINSKVYTIINIIGLAVGITCTIILSLFVVDELSYDNFYENSDRIYRVYVKMNFNGIESINGKVSAPMGLAIVANYPEVEKVVRLGFFGHQNLSYNDKKFREWRIYGVDSNYFDFASLRFIVGDRKSALLNPNSIVLSEDAAKKYFGKENPLGKIIKSEEWGSYIVKGVYENYPNNSHFKADYLISMSSFPESRNQDWINLTYYTLVLLREGVDPQLFEQKIQELVYGHFSLQIQQLLGFSVETLLKNGNEYSFNIQPLADVYLYSARQYGIDVNSEWGDIKIGDIAYVYIFLLVAFFILLLAIINYMNLSTARAERRAKEVGIRKTLGANKSKIVWQFISESIITASLSVLLALVLLEIFLPIFNSISDKSLSISYFNNIFVVPGLILGTIFIGMLAGSYPAFYLSSINPIKIFKSGRIGRKRNLHTVLVIFQFAISIILIISTVIIKEQLSYMQNKSLGFNKEHLITIYNSQQLGNNLKSFTEDILSNSKVLAATNADRMFESGIPSNGYILDNKLNDTPTLCQSLQVDYDFIKTFQIKLLEGRFFSKEFSTDSNAVIINKAAAHAIYEANLIGKELTKIGVGVNQKKDRVIGIIDDFNYESLHQEVRPLVLHLGKPTVANSTLTMRISSQNIIETIDDIKDKWTVFSGEKSINLSFVDESLQRLYKAEEKVGLIITIFTSLALVIACLGLFGLATFVTEQKVKEIGIRKSLGASVFEIVILLSKEFSKWVLIANIFAWPIAYYFMDKWLQDFAYRISISLNTFFVAGFTAFLLAIATVSFKAIKAAMANPVESLRDE